MEFKIGSKHHAKRLRLVPTVFDGVIAVTVAMKRTIAMKNPPSFVQFLWQHKHLQYIKNTNANCCWLFTTIMVLVD